MRVVPPTPTTAFVAAGSGAGRTTLVHFDHMNDHKGYSKLLSTWARQLRLGGVLFLSLHCTPRPRNLFLVLDAKCEGTDEFLTRLRTQNVDVNMRGQPCKERMSQVVASLPLASASADEATIFEIVESEGSTGSQTHMPFVREWLREHRLDAEDIITAMDTYLDQTTKPGKRR
jgi:hypothetical protein